MLTGNSLYNTSLNYQGLVPIYNGQSICFIYMANISLPRKFSFGNPTIDDPGPGSGLWVFQYKSAL
jgi:hypothetical protein